MSDKQPVNSGGMGFLGWLTLLFIALKLTGYINWSWWLVLAPVWIPISLVLLALMCLVLIGLVKVFIGK